MKSAESEVGEHNADGTTESQAWKTGGVYRAWTFALWSPLWQQPGSRALLWRVDPLVEVSLPWVLPVLGWEQLPAFANRWAASSTTAFPFFFFCSFISYVTNFLHGIPRPLPQVWVSWLIHTDTGGCAQRTIKPEARGKFQLSVKGLHWEWKLENFWRVVAIIFPIC